MNAREARKKSSYDELKDFGGKKYTGMKVGGHHKWHYAEGDWKEVKVAPDRWEFNFAVPKRRAGHAPPGSGVPIGTAYHWYILAHQTVEKLDDNTYNTAMSGLKIKLAHKRANTDKWSSSEAAQRRALIKTLQRMIQDLEAEEGQSIEAPATEPAKTEIAKEQIGKMGHQASVQMAPRAPELRARVPLAGVPL